MNRLSPIALNHLTTQQRIEFAAVELDRARNDLNLGAFDGMRIALENAGFLDLLIENDALRGQVAERDHSLRVVRDGHRAAA